MLSRLKVITVEAKCYYILDLFTFRLKCYSFRTSLHLVSVITFRRSTNVFLTECFHSRGLHLYKFIGTKESVYTRKEFNSHRTGLEHQHGRVWEHQYCRCDIMWKRFICFKFILYFFLHFSFQNRIAARLRTATLSPQTVRPVETVTIL